MNQRNTTRTILAVIIASALVISVGDLDQKAVRASERVFGSTAAPLREKQNIKRPKKKQK